MTMLPMDAAGHRPAFFPQEGLDQVVSMVLELAADLWVVRERVFILEAVLSKHGTPVADAIEAYVPTQEEQSTLAKMRADMTAQMFRSLNRDHRPLT
jgi:hypothetical protein